MTENNLPAQPEEQLTEEKKRIIERKVRAAMAIGGNLNADVINNLNADVINNLNAYVINNLNAYVINNLNADVINNLNADVIKNLNADVIKNLNADVINNLNADVIKNLNAYVIKNLNADVIKNLNADVIKNLNADVIKNLNAYVIKNLKKKVEEWESIPVLERPYTKLWKDIQEKKRVHMQSTFGDLESWEDACSAENNICNTPMCTAGHLVHMAGEIGYKLQDKYGWEGAASLIHLKAHPEYPIQNFGGIPQENALAYIEEMAEMEAQEEPKK